MSEWNVGVDGFSRRGGGWVWMGGGEEESGCGWVWRRGREWVWMGVEERKRVGGYERRVCVEERKRVGVEERKRVGVDEWRRGREWVWMGVDERKRVGVACSESGIIRLRDEWGGGGALFLRVTSGAQSEGRVREDVRGKDPN
ncbi:hypothetical protein Pmani_018460 [Petrolisthes manimaculis]|uniref:Uncharacterized protein n=1 Tax=Petrolisthes manimaculis TaxID=1843537 RepID=A0AAE1PKC3_9EUCA|nr:hypothetical protein Pmani_018460 [Petrolisthes manimaculis]